MLTGPGVMVTEAPTGSKSNSTCAPPIRYASRPAIVFSCGVTATDTSAMKPPLDVFTKTRPLTSPRSTESSRPASRTSSAGSVSSGIPRAAAIVPRTKRDDADDDVAERAGLCEPVHGLVQRSITTGDEERLAAVRHRHLRAARSASPSPAVITIVTSSKRSFSLVFSSSVFRTALPAGARIQDDAAQRHQPSDRSEIQRQVLRSNPELRPEITNGLFEAHQREPHGFGLLRGQRARVHPPDRLPLQQLPDEFDERSTSFTTDRRTSSGSAFQRGGGAMASRSSCSRIASSSCTSTVAIERFEGFRGDDIRRDALGVFMNGSEQLRCEREDRPGPGDGDGMPRKHGLQSGGPLTGTNPALSSGTR